MVCLSRAQLSMLLEGIDWRRPIRTAAPSLAVWRTSLRENVRISSCHRHEFAVMSHSCGMDAVSSETKRRNQLPDLDSLDVASAQGARARQTHRDREPEICWSSSSNAMHFRPAVGEDERRYRATRTPSRRPRNESGRSGTTSRSNRRSLAVQCVKVPNKPASPPASGRTAAARPKRSHRSYGSLPGLRWHASTARRRRLRGTRIRSRSLQSHPGTVRPKLSCACCFTHRAGTGAASSDRPGVSPAPGAALAHGFAGCRSMRDHLFRSTDSRKSMRAKGVRNSIVRDHG